MSEIKAGDRVRHELMGEGVATGLYDFRVSRVFVEFDNGLELMCKIDSLVPIEPERRCTCGKSGLCNHVCEVKPKTFTVTIEIDVAEYEAFVDFNEAATYAPWFGDVDAAYQAQVKS